uniref:C-type lectin domain-containing protein n=1 Tax=Anabas testudineus TaxID=64144 RepID=A0A7N6ASJ2_ANATE
MSTVIYATPVFSNKVRYNRKEEEDGGKREEREVVIYESADDIRDDHTDFQSPESEEGPQVQDPPPVQRKSFRAAALCLGVLCLLMMVGLIILSVRHVLFNVDLQTRYNNLNDNYNNLNKNFTDLQKTVAGKFCPEGWKKFRCSCYFKSTENKTWSESRTDCENRESDLVMINSKEEQDFVSQMSMNRESWIGLTVTTHGSNIRYSWSWAWVDGSPLTETFWAAGQREAPLNSFSRVALGQSGKWKTQVYYSGNFWICEKKVTCSC